MITLAQPMKRHASKPGRNTPWHREAERVRLMNARVTEDIRSIYLAELQLAEIQWQKKHSHSARRKKFEADWSQLQFELIPYREHPPLGIWRRQCERDDIRAYGAKRTGGLVDIANHQHGLWWYRLTEAQRFAIVLLSVPVIADDAAQERREQSYANRGAD